MSDATPPKMSADQCPCTQQSLAPMGVLSIPPGTLCPECNNPVSKHETEAVKAAKVKTLSWTDANPYEAPTSHTSTQSSNPFSMIDCLCKHYGPKYSNVQHCWILKTRFPNCRVKHSVGAHIIPRRARHSYLLKALQVGPLQSWTVESIDHPRNGIVMAKFLEHSFDQCDWCFLPSKNPKTPNLWQIKLFRDKTEAIPLIDFNQRGEQIDTTFDRGDDRTEPVTFGCLTEVEYDLGDASVSALGTHAFFTYKLHGKVEEFPHEAFKHRAKDDSPIKKAMILQYLQELPLESPPACDLCSSPVELFEDVVSGGVRCVQCWVGKRCDLCGVTLPEKPGAVRQHFNGTYHKSKVQQEGIKRKTLQ